MDRLLPGDTRGIVDPAGMMRHVDFARFPAGDELDGLVEWFWSVSWELPGGVAHDQEVLNHPAGNISIGTLDDAGVPLDPPEGRVYGLTTGVSLRHLTDAGWTVAARTSVGGLGAFLGRSARTATDAVLGLEEAMPGVGGNEVVAAVCAESTDEARVGVLRQALADVIDRRDPALVAEAREVARVAALAEHDAGVRHPEDLASAAGVSVRTLQRLFDQHVGASPSWVIRRWRIIDAVEAACAAFEADREWRGWAMVAAELGYADQAHLARDFRRHLGISPSAYLTRVAGFAAPARERSGQG